MLREKTGSILAGLRCPVCTKAAGEGGTMPRISDGKEGNKVMFLRNISLFIVSTCERAGGQEPTKPFGGGAVGTGGRDCCSPALPIHRASVFPLPL